MEESKEHIRIKAWNVVTKVCLALNKVETKVIGPVEFEVEVSEEEAEKIRAQMMCSEFYEPRPYGGWAEKGSELLAQKFGPQDPLAHILLKWAEGERERMTDGCRFLTQEDIDKKKAYLDSLGTTLPSREELLAGIENCFIWKEVWTRETGHLWELYTLLKRTPSQEEYDFADTWNFYPIRLKEFTTEAIIQMLREA